MAWLASALGASQVDTWFTELKWLVQHTLLVPLNSSRISKEQTTMLCGMSHDRKVLGKRRNESFFSLFWLFVFSFFFIFYFFLFFFSFFSFFFFFFRFSFFFFFIYFFYFFFFIYRFFF